MKTLNDIGSDHRPILLEISTNKKEGKKCNTGYLLNYRKAD
jgi:hypothetical protein